MTKMESVEGKNKSAAYLQGCSVQGAIEMQQHDDFVVIVFNVKAGSANIFTSLLFTWRVPIPIGLKG